MYLCKLLILNYYYSYSKLFSLDAELRAQKEAQKEDDPPITVEE